jgi:hypothetical protein
MGRLEEMVEDGFNEYLLPGRQRRQVLTNISTSLHGIIFEKTIILTG